MWVGVAGCDWSDKQQHRAIRTRCSHTPCIDSHTNTCTLACSLQILGDYISFGGVREPLSICGRLPELPGELGCLNSDFYPSQGNITALFSFYFLYSFIIIMTVTKTVSIVHAHVVYGQEL